MFHTVSSRHKFNFNFDSTTFQLHLGDASSDTRRKIIEIANCDGALAQVLGHACSAQMTWVLTQFITPFVLERAISP